MNERTKAPNLKLVAFGEALSLVIYYAVAWFLINKSPESIASFRMEPGTINMVTGAFALFSLAILPTALFLRSGAERAAEQNKDSPKTQGMKMVLISMSNTPGILGLVLVILSGKIDYYYPFAAWAALLLSMFWPKED